MEKQFRPYCGCGSARTFNSATARSRGETCKSSAWSRGPPAFNSATARSRGETQGDGHPVEQQSAFNSATARSRGETPGGASGTTCEGTFNSATARSRGETSDGEKVTSRASHLQFGHGTEPWRNVISPQCDLRGRRSFNSATAEKLVSRAGLFHPPLTFNSATARSRGETSAQGKPAKFKKFALQFGHGTEPWRNLQGRDGNGAEGLPSIRPRHGAVEKPNTSG